MNIMGEPEEFVQESHLTARALIIGIILAAAACLVVSWAELVIAQIQIATLQFAPSAVGFLVIVALLNVVVRNLNRRLALRPAEIITIYAMVLIASLVTSRGVLERLIPTLVASNYYATPANHWAELLKYIPQWAVPWDVNGGSGQAITRTFYEGLRQGESIPWRPWVTPLAAWGVVVLLIIFASMCLATVLRRQWADNEKLAFPFAILPLELATDTAGPKSFFRNKLMWIGFLIPTVIYMLNGLHANYPGLPQFTIFWNLNPNIAAMGKPWSDMGAVFVALALGAIGFFCFLPTELLFTMWFFFLFARLQNVGFSMVGLAAEPMPMYPTTIWNGYQIAGAFFVVAAYMVKSAWPHLKRVWHAAVRPVPAEEPELLPLRWAVFGFPLAAAGVAIWMAKLGMSPVVAIVQVVVYLFVTIPVMARSVNEAGFLETETAFRPVDMIRMFTPLQSMGARNMSALSLTDSVFMRDQRGNLLGAFLDTLKMGDAVRLNRRSLLIALVCAICVALVAGGALAIIMPYRIGAVGMYWYVYQGTPNWVAGDYATTLAGTPKFDARLLPFFTSGAALTLVCAVMRARFLWWPLAPLGIAMSGVWTLNVFWFSIFLAWLIKTTIMRYGGMKVFRSARPIFLGLILGDFSQAVIWTVICGIWRLQAPYFPG